MGSQEGSSRHIPLDFQPVVREVPFQHTAFPLPAVSDQSVAVDLWLLFFSELQLGAGSNFELQASALLKTLRCHVCFDRCVVYVLEDHTITSTVGKAVVASEFVRGGRCFVAKLPLDSVKLHTTQGARSRGRHDGDGYGGSVVT